MDKKKKEWPITVRLQEDEYSYVVRLSNAEDRSLSVVARHLLRWGIEHHKRFGKLVPDNPRDPKSTPADKAGKKETGAA